MIGLDATQQLFYRAITWPRGVDNFLAQADAATRAEFEAVFGESPRFARNERVDVYANAYFHRLLGALEEMLPRLASLCEPVGFHNLITDYVLACPSNLPDLRRFGDRLPDFLAEHVLGEQWPVLVTVAHIELALSDALDAPDADWVTPEALQKVAPESWPELRFALAPAARILSLHWDWNSIAQACDQQDRDRALGSKRLEGEQSWLVSRKGHAVCARGLGEAEGQALNALAAGHSFGETCDRVSQEVEGFGASTMVEFLGQWLSGQVLAWPNATEV